MPHVPTRRTDKDDGLNHLRQGGRYLIAKCRELLQRLERILLSRRN